MGLDYCLWCFACAESSMRTEFSAVGYVSMKHPDEAEEVVNDWVEFMADHKTHHIGLIDAKGNESDPRKLNGKYILGIKENID